MVAQLKSPARIMIVDDSAVMRGMMYKILETDPMVTIVGSHGNGQIALDALSKTDTDIVITDIEMPVMDGLTAIPKMLALKPDLKILVCSSLSAKNAEVSIKAMSLGALDCLLKPSTLSGGAETFREDLFWKLKTIQNATPLARLASRSHATPSTATPNNTISLHKNIMTFNGKPDILAIGCSTGGPVALQKLIPYLKGVNIPVVITQHMPATFTKIFAENLEKQTGIPCSEGIDGESLKAGHIYIAPGNYHMILERNNGIPTIRLNQNPPENFCRPAVDPMFRSVVEVYNNRILAVILTGMGQDGLEGSRAIVKNNGKLIAQNEASSVVWGMPGAVAKAGICSEIMDLEQMGAWLRNTLQIR